MNTGDIIGIVAIALAVVGAGIAYNQLLRTQGLARGQFLLAIDQSLTPFERVRREINKKRKPTDGVELRRYMAAIERIGYLFAKGYLEREAIRICYGSRLVKLINCTDPDYVLMIIRVKSSDEDPDDEEAGAWPYFVSLWRELQKPLGLRDVPSGL